MRLASGEPELGEIPPGLLDLTEYFGLGDQLALQTAAESQQKRIRGRTDEMLQRAVRWKLLRAPTSASVPSNTATRRWQVWITNTAGSVNPAGTGAARSAPLQHIEGP